MVITPGVCSEIVIRNLLQIFRIVIPRAILMLPSSRGKLLSTKVSPEKRSSSVKGLKLVTGACTVLGGTGSPVVVAVVDGS